MSSKWALRRVVIGRKSLWIMDVAGETSMPEVTRYLETNERPHHIVEGWCGPSELESALPRPLAKAEE